MSKTSKIEYEVRVGASESGGSHYEAILRCPRKKRLDAEARAGQTRHLITGAFGIGTLFHAYLELWYLGKISNPDEFANVVWTGPVDIDSEAEDHARRCATEYAIRYSPKSYGKVLFCEQDIPLVPADKECVEQAVGIAPWTGKMDMACKLDKKSAEALQREFGLDVQAGKKYLVDWKTASSETKNLREKFQYRHQFKAYLAAANAVEEKYGREPYAGLIADVTIKTKIPKFLRVLCDPPTETDLGVLAERWKAVEVFSRYLPDWANASDDNCFAMWGTCEHFLNSRCDRNGLVSIGGK